MTVLNSVCGENLACIRGGRQVFGDLSFRVNRGEALSLEGPNGSGKTSLLRLIGGLLPPSAGFVNLLTDKGQIREPEERARLAAWLGHQNALKPQLTPKETLAFFARFYGPRLGASAAIDAVVEVAGLSRIADVPCQYLSAGQKRRLAIARLELAGRPLWLLDEPFSSLDASGKKVVRDMIGAHCASGGIALVATHEPLDVESRRLGLA
ncbi:MAG TPA: heme ABC exporter ATP-binding protein CcmA [Rhizomicrobium sp.]|nr:heme ABC exporter ATP-binding protein CcmA [Rhizomicrobium sp.]